MDGRSGPAATALIALALAAAAGACGTTDEDANTEAADGARSPTQPSAEQPLSPIEERGRELFIANCGSCHTLDAAGTQGQIGPNLDEAQVDEAEVLAKIAEGPGAMPENLVSGADADAVAAFVAASGG